MFRVETIHQSAGAHAQRATTAWRTVRAQPNWLIRAVVIAFLLVIGLPILLLVLIALIAATALFLMLWGVNALVMRVRGAIPGSDGRENVRVIQRREG